MNIVWTPETVAKMFEVGPMAYTPGTKMPEQKIGSAEERKALVEFLAKATKKNVTCQAFASRRPCFPLALAQVIVGGAHRRALGAGEGIEFSSAMAVTRQSAHILMTSSRFLEFSNIQCWPSSLAATRSTELLTPNGLPQRMQSERLFLLDDAARCGGGAEIDLRLQA